MRKFLTILAFIFIIFEVSGQTTLDTAVNFNLKDIHYNKHNLFNMLDSGKFVVIDFFAASCGACATYAPEMQHTYTHYGYNTGNVYVMGIAWGGTNAIVAEWDSTYGVTFPSVSGNEGNGNTACSAYNITSFPTAILIAPNHLVVNKYIYPPDFHNLDSVIAASLSAVAGLSGPVNNPSFVIKGPYPNPADKNLSLDLSLRQNREIEVELQDLLGNRVTFIPVKLYQPGNHHLQFNLEAFPSGIYFVKIMSEGQCLHVNKFIRQ